MRVLTQYRWFYHDKTHGRMEKTSYWATEEDILKIHPDAERIPWSRRVIEIPDIPLFLLAGRDRQKS